MRITQWGEYGVHCCVFIALRYSSASKTASAAEIAESQKIDPLYAQQILQRLRRAKLIQSVRGPGGGYQLTRAPDQITLYDILRAAEGKTFEVICDTKPLSAARCSSGTACGLRGIWQELGDQVNLFLGSYSLADLVQRELAAARSQKDNTLISIGSATRTIG